MANLYRVLPQFRKHFAPYDGGLYEELEPPNAIGYARISLDGKPRSIPVSNFERIAQEPEAPT